MSIPSSRPQVLDFFGTALVVEPSPGQRSGDAGLLPIRQFDDRLGLTLAFTHALDDPRDPDLTEHPFREMVRSRGSTASWPAMRTRTTTTPCAPTPSSG